MSIEVKDVLHAALWNLRELVRVIRKWEPSSVVSTAEFVSGLDQIDSDLAQAQVNLGPQQTGSESL